jgi:hypothetical protein
MLKSLVRLTILRVNLVRDSEEKTIKFVNVLKFSIKNKVCEEYV